MEITKTSVSAGQGLKKKWMRQFRFHNGGLYSNTPLITSFGKKIP